MDSRGDQARFFGKLAALMAAGIPLLRAFEVGIEGVRDAGLAAALSRVLDGAYGGSSLTEAFEREAGWFTSEIRTLISVGEERGEIERVAGAISDGLERYVFDPGRPGRDEAGDVLSRLIEEAAGRGARSVHAEPVPDGLRVRLRVRGALEESSRLDGVAGAELLARLRGRAGLGPGPAARPESGEFVEGETHVHVELCPFVEGEGVVLRLSTKRPRAPSLADAGLAEKVGRRICNWLSQPNGLILVTGPRGSGRLDLMAAMAGEIGPDTRRVLAVGESTAFRLPGVARIPARALGYSEALEAALGQDLDALLVEEIPDRAAASMIVEAARSGHLVIAATRAPGAVEGVAGLFAMGVEPVIAADALIGAISCHREDGHGLLKIGPELAAALKEDPSCDRFRVLLKRG